MSYNLMTLAERIAELEERLKRCAPADLVSIFAIRLENVELCLRIEGVRRV